MKKIIPALIILAFVLPNISLAHRSGCHRWHSCPSDSGSYTCGDAGYPCQYPTFPASGGVVYPPNGYYKDCYDCPLKKVPANSYTSGISFACNSGYKINFDKTACISIPAVSSKKVESKPLIVIQKEPKTKKTPSYIPVAQREEVLANVISLQEEVTVPITTRQTKKRNWINRFFNWLFN